MLRVSIGNKSTQAVRLEWLTDPSSLTPIDGLEFKCLHPSGHLNKDIFYICNKPGQSQHLQIITNILQGTRNSL